MLGRFQRRMPPNGQLVGISPRAAAGWKQIARRRFLFRCAQYICMSSVQDVDAWRDAAVASFATALSRHSKQFSEAPAATIASTRRAPPSPLPAPEILFDRTSSSTALETASRGVSTSAAAASMCHTAGLWMQSTGVEAAMAAPANAPSVGGEKESANSSSFCK